MQKCVGAEHGVRKQHFFVTSLGLPLDSPRDHTLPTLKILAVCLWGVPRTRGEVKAATAEAVRRTGSRRAGPGSAEQVRGAARFGVPGRAGNRYPLSPLWAAHPYTQRVSPCTARARSAPLSLPPFRLPLTLFRSPSSLLSPLRCRQSARS